MTTDSDRLLADGIPVTFADGTHHLRYPMRALKQLEDAFDGSLDNVLAWFVEPSTHFLRNLTTLLAIGLAHEGYDVEKVDEQAITQRMAEYRQAAMTAFLQAIPGPPEQEPQSGKDDAANGSTGPASTTPPPSDSAAAMTTSGAV